jgi:hypothetical protein
MKSKKQSRSKNTVSTTNNSRRAFLKQSFAFAAVTSTYSVFSLANLACNNNPTTSINGGNYFLSNYYFDNYFNDYFNDYFDDYFDDYFNDYFDDYFYFDNYFDFSY